MVLTMAAAVIAFKRSLLAHLLQDTEMRVGEPLFTVCLVAMLALGPLIALQARTSGPR